VNFYDNDALGHDYHRYMSPTAMYEAASGGDINRLGYASDGSILWIHGPEPLGPRGGQRWAVRRRTLAFNRGHMPGSYVWDRGCYIFATRTEALACFRRLTTEVSA
jgi:hypothetical protein